jgi:prepilin-type N-terminal cleavage/methylation domain-containing protein
LEVPQEELEKRVRIGEAMVKRNGYTLVEMLAAIGVSGVVMAIAVGLLLSLFKLDQSSRDHSVDHQSLARLEADFRGDAHAATSLVRSEGPAKGQEIVGEGKKGPAWELRFPQPDRSVRYAWQGGGLVREERAGKATRRDGYRLPPGSTVAFERSPPIVSLRVVCGTPSGDRAVGRTIRIDAVLGSDHRFENRGETKK